MSNPLSTPARSSLASTFTPTRASSNPYGASSSSSARPTTASLIAPSPHYVTKDHKRHSLYGVEDRVVIDPGSSVWKVGFSGEAKPRAVFWANQEETVPSRSGREVASSIWDTEFEPVADSVGWRGEQERKREVGEQVVDERIARIVRDVYSKHLMTDPKSRKVIVIENPLLPTRIKEMIARALFEDLQVPSVSFLPPQLLALLAVGRTSGLIVDVGFLETVVLPIQLSRPLFSSLQSTSIASRHIHQTLHSLLLHFARFIPSPTSLSAASTVPHTGKNTGIPVTEEILARKGVLEKVLSGGCFVAPAPPPPLASSSAGGGREEGAGVGDEGDSSLMDAGEDKDDPERPIPPHLLALKARAFSTSNTRPLSIPIPFFRGEGLASGTLVIPGWIRERLAEDAFFFTPSPPSLPNPITSALRGGGGGEDDQTVFSGEEKSVVEVVLAVLEKLPIDLRTPMAGSLLVTGGGSLLPGFISRLRSSLLAALAPNPTLQAISSLSSATPRPRTIRPRPHSYACLLPLRSKLSILNDPSPPFPSPPSAGSAPAFSPSLLAWIGGSTAGSMRIGGRSETGRERWDEGRKGRRRVLRKVRDAAAARGGAGKGSERTSGDSEDEEEDEDVVLRRMGGIEVVGDWSRDGIYGVGR